LPSLLNYLCPLGLPIKNFAYNSLLVMLQHVTNILAALTTFVRSMLYSGTPLIRINLDGEPSGYAEKSDNWIFFLKIGSLNFGCYYLWYAAASKHFDQVLEATTL